MYEENVRVKREMFMYIIKLRETFAVTSNYRTKRLERITNKAYAWVICLVKIK